MFSNAFVFHIPANEAGFIIHCTIASGDFMTAFRVLMSQSVRLPSFDIWFSVLSNMFNLLTSFALFNFDKSENHATFSSAALAFAIDATLLTLPTLPATQMTGITVLKTSKGFS